MAARDTTLTLIRRDALEVPSLVVVSDALRAPLGLRPVIVGSDPDCDLSLCDPRISRQHCRLSLSDDGIVLEDLGSKNGTFIRDVRIRAALLAPGVGVTLGGATTLSVQIAGVPSVVPLSLAARFGEAIGGSLAMRALFAELEALASTEAPVVLWGETGTGKELLARALHERGARRAGPFEVLDCAGVSATLLEGELFGWERGAFTGALHASEGVLARAHGGTLFVDEIGELPLELQPKLLRALDSGQIKPLGSNEYRRVDVRIVAATHRDLRRMVTEGTFRDDLYYRIAVAQVRVPPLRERRDDIPLLVERLLAAHHPPKSLDDLPPGALALFDGHDWPGNVRELDNTVARLVLFPEIERGELVPSNTARGHEALMRLPLREARSLLVESFERQYVETRLRDHAGNVSRTAEAMGVSRQFLHRLLDRYAIRRETEW